MTWIGGLVIQSEKFRNIKNPTEYAYLHFTQISMMAEILGKDAKGLAVNPILFQNHPDFIQNREYSIPRVLGYDLNVILNIYVNKGILEKKL